MGNKGGRPPLTEGKRAFKIDVRFTEAEYRQVEALEKSLGLKKAELIRRRVLRDVTGSGVHAGHLLTRLDQLSLELARTGNNVNQLARHANRLQKHGVLSPKVAFDILELLSGHRAQQTELATLFRKLLRALR